MPKKILLIALFGTVWISSFVLGAAPTFQQISRDSQEMRKNVAWLTEGLYNLENHPKLALTKAQKKRILPFFQALIAQKIILLNQEPEHNRQNQNEFRRQGAPDANAPQFQARIRRMQEQTAYGNSQVDAIDRILTPAQLIYIDNMEFNPEKYGFIDLAKLFGGGGQRQGQRPDRGTIETIRKKTQAGREELIQLNNEVLQLLSN